MCDENEDIFVHSGILIKYPKYQWTPQPKWTLTHEYAQKKPKKFHFFHSLFNIFTQFSGPETKPYVPPSLCAFLHVKLSERER